MECFIDGMMMQHLVEDLHVCPSCSLISSDIEPDLGLYDKSYFTKYRRYEKAEANIPLQEYRLAVTVGNPGNAEESPILDYGCGSGAFIRYASGKGYPVVGYDINPFSGFCDPAVLLGNYRALTMWDVVEHICNPMPLLQGIRHKVLAISTPCVDSWPGEVSDLTNWKHYYPGEHVHYFTEEALTALFDSLGYKTGPAVFGESQFRPGCGGKNIMTMVGVKKNG